MKKKTAAAVKVPEEVLDCVLHDAEFEEIVEECMKDPSDHEDNDTEFHGHGQAESF